MGGEHSFVLWGGLSALGLAVGVIAGMFGVGGGFLMTPLLAILFGVPLPVAVGTGLCQMIGLAVAALLRHRKLQHGEVKIDWLMLAGSLLGIGLSAQTVIALSALGTVILHGHTIGWAKLSLLLGYIVLLATLLVGTIAHARDGHVHLGMALTLLAGSVVGRNPHSADKRTAAERLFCLSGYFNRDGRFVGLDTHFGVV